MTPDPKNMPDERPQDRESDSQDDEQGSVSESAANPTPPATDATTSEDVHDSPQLPTRDDE